MPCPAAVCSLGGSASRGHPCGNSNVFTQGLQIMGCGVSGLACLAVGFKPEFTVRVQGF